MLYILECMFYAFTVIHGGNDQPLKTTGQALTWNDVGVSVLGWGIVVLLVIFIRYCIAYAVRRHKNKTCDTKADTDYAESELWGGKSFWRGILYSLECFALPIKCLFGGKNVTFHTTGKTPTSKEVVFCIFSWAYIILIVVAIVLICV